MAETFTAIASRLKGVLEDIAQNESYNENGSILVVTHAFAIKTLLYLFAPEQLCAVEKVKNVAILRLIYDEGKFHF